MSRTLIHMKSAERTSGEERAAPLPGVSRRAFLRGLGTAAVTAAASGTAAVAAEMEKARGEIPQGPGEVPVEFVLNGRHVDTRAEPRETLLEVLRTRFNLTGAKEGCDRGTCGACTVLLDGEPVYACSTLAIEAAGHAVTTIEGLAEAAGGLTKLQQALVQHDGLQCGYCTPGVVMTLTALLLKNPRPTEAEVRAASAGHLCRCGSYPRIFAATLTASGQSAASTVRVLQPHDHHALA